MRILIYLFPKRIKRLFFNNFFLMRIVSFLLVFSITFLTNFNWASAFLLPGSFDTDKSNVSGVESAKMLAASFNTDINVSSKSDNLGSTLREVDKVPKVDINLTPTRPSNQDLVHAQALSQGFRNSSIKLYYNWYIFNPDPKIGSTILKNGQKVFVPSNTLEGALLRGAIAQVRGTYVPGTTKTAKDLGKPSEGQGIDRDGYFANFGGDDGKGGLSKNIKDILGKDYDFNYEDFSSSCKQNCKVSYNNAESEVEWKHESCFKPTCDSWIDQCCSVCKDTYSSCLSGIWTNVEEDCFDEVCDGKDKDRKNACFKTLALSQYENCNSDFLDRENDCTNTRDLCCLNNGGCGSKPAQDCTECDREYNKNKWDILKQKDYCLKKCEVSDNNSLGSLSVEPVGSRCFRYNFGGRDIKDHLAGIFQPITCGHLFPGSTYPNEKLNWEMFGSLKTGDGKFEEEEELFWGTDASNADTDGDGVPDEGDIVGLSQQSIEFNYQTGDKIGVTVEGTSIFSTNENTPYYKIMWAFMDTCSSESIRQSEKDFKNLCECDDKKDGVCDSSKDFGFGFLALKDIWQNTESIDENKIETMINLYPLRPTVKDDVYLEAIASAGSGVDRDLLSYSWTLKHGGAVLKPEKDLKNGRLVWKKGNVEVAYTPLQNQLASYKEEGTLGWSKLNLDPVLEGEYTALVRATEIKDTAQKLGEATLNFEVSEELKIVFSRLYFTSNKLEERGELEKNETTKGDIVMAEYKGGLFDEFAWYVDKKQMEGNGAKMSLKIDKNAGSSYEIKLVATNRSRTHTAESSVILKVINPFVRIRPSEETFTQVEYPDKGQSEKKDSMIFRVPRNTDLTFLSFRGPAASDFASRSDVRYFWSFDGEKFKEGQDKITVKMDDSYLPGTPHNLKLKIESSDQKHSYEDGITLVPMAEGNSVISGKETVGGLAFAYLNVSSNLRFALQSVIWAIFLYLLLSAVAWVSFAGEKKRRRKF